MSWNFHTELYWLNSYKVSKESCFSDYWKVSSVVPVFKDVKERSAAKNYCSFSLLSVASKETCK